PLLRGARDQQHLSRERVDPGADEGRSTRGPYRARLDVVAVGESRLRRHAGPLAPERAHRIHSGTRNHHYAAQAPSPCVDRRRGGPRAYAFAFRREASGFESLTPYSGTCLTIPTRKN